MRSIVTIGMTLGMLATVALPAVGRDQTGQSQQQEKPKDPPATPDTSSVAGRWDMWVTTDQGNMGSTLDLKLDGKKVAGTITSERGTSPIEGEFAEGKLTFWLTMQGSSGSMQITFAGAMKEDGSLSGTLDAQGYQIPWTATRSKVVK